MFKIAHVLLFPLYFIMVSNALAQQSVGIGTKTPRTKLEVAGSMNVSGQLDFQKDAITENDRSTFLIQNNNDKIKTLDVSNPTGAALGYIQEYVIENPNGDWVKDFDTQVDASEFVMISISAFYNVELVISSDDALANGSAPYTAAFIKNGTWHLIADFPVVSNIAGSGVGTWRFTTLIFSKDLSKQFSDVIVNMANESTGVAANPIID